MFDDDVVVVAAAAGGGIAPSGIDCAISKTDVLQSGASRAAWRQGRRRLQARPVRRRGSAV